MKLPRGQFAPNRLITLAALAPAVLCGIFLSTLHVTGASGGSRLDITTPPTSLPASFALSPDGKQIAYVASADGASRLWVRTLESPAARPLPGTEGARNPFWAPDGRSLGFFADLKLKRIDLGGGQLQTLAEVLSMTAQGAWSPEGVILFNANAFVPLSRVPASGGKVILATTLGEGQRGHRAPRFLPGGRQFLFASIGADSAIWLGSLDGAAPRRITAITAGADSAAEFLAPGFLVRVRQNSLVAQRFDAERDKLSGSPMLLAKPVGVDPITLAGSFSVSPSDATAAPSGNIAWRASGGISRQLTWFNRSGTKLGTLGPPDDSNLLHLELSPDGNRALITHGPVGSADIAMLEGAHTRAFASDPADDRFTIWSPDGTRVVFASNRKGVFDLYQKASSGSGAEEILLESAESKRPNSWSRDGRFLLYNSDRNNGDLMVLPMTGERKPFLFLSTRFDEQDGVFSPDGKWVAYQSNESGQFEVYVRPFPGPGAALRVSTGGGNSAPRWRTDGKELYYATPDGKLMAVAVTAQGTALTLGKPEVLFQTQIATAVQRPQFDVARDGRFLVNLELAGASAGPIHVLLNWRAESEK
jgi:Tol biopolymer transport system component